MKEKVKLTKETIEFRKNNEVFMAHQRTYVGLVCVLEEKKLSCQARVLYQIISSLSYVEGYCYATNDQLSEKLGLSITMVKTYLKELETKEFINTKKCVTRFGTRRRIFICFDAMRKRYLMKPKIKSKNPFRLSHPENWVDQYPKLDE